MSFGVNMLRADPKLWVPVSTKYTGFAYTPTKEWLTNANTKASAEHSGHTYKEKSTIPRNTKTTVNVCA
jgi:hypothetical protein